MAKDKKKQNGQNDSVSAKANSGILKTVIIASAAAVAVVAIVLCILLINGKRIEELEKSHADALAALSGQTSTDLAAMREQIATKTAEKEALLTTYNEKVAEIAAQKAANDAAIATLTAEHEEAIETLEDEIAALEAQIADLTEDAEEEIAALEDEIAEKQAAINELNAAYDGKVQELAAANAAHDTAIAALTAEYNAQIAELNAQIDVLIAKIKHNVTFDVKNAEGDFDSFIAGEAQVIASLPTPVRGGYEFVCWRVDGEVITLPYTVLEDTEFEAVYVPVTNTVTYVLGDKGTMPAGSPTTYTVETGLQLPTPTSTNSNYVFSGWYESYDFSGNRLYRLSVGDYGNKTLYAKWSAATGGVTYELVGSDFYVVTGIDGTKDDIVIKSTFEGKPVTAIVANAFKNKQKLTSVTVPDSITSIGESAFEGCISLTTLNLGSDVKSIPYRMAYGCTSLQSINIPSGVDSIGKYAFYQCAALTTATIPGSVKTIGERAFYQCSTLEDVEIGYGVTKIDYYAFSECVAIKNIELPDSITSLEIQTFRSCSGLETIKLSNGLTSLKGNLFANCSSLKEIHIPSNIEVIGDYVFIDCSSLTKITVADDNQNYKSVDGVLYTKDGKTLILYPAASPATSFNIPDGVTKISGSAFSRAKNLISVTMTDTVEAIEDDAFAYCDNLRKIRLSENLMSLGAYAFYDCESLMSITIPDAVTSIGTDAFALCSYLTSVTLGRGVESIANNAFNGCDNLYVIYNNSSLKLICGDDKNGRIAKYAKAVVDNGVSTYVDDGNTYVLDGDFLYQYDGTTYKLIAYTGGELSVTLPTDIDGNSYEIYKLKGVTEVIIPDTFTKISDNAFRDCDWLTGITISDSVKEIGEYAFYNYDYTISELYIGKNVKIICKY